jgi:hypothetical protein
VTLKEFLSDVRAKAPPALSEASLKFSAGEYYREGKITGKHVIECIRDAIRLEKYRSFCLAQESEARESTSDGDEGLPQTPLLTRDDYLDKLQPFTKSVRQNIFQQDHAPFASKEAAAAWIQDKASNPRRASREEQARLSQIDDGLRALHLEWRALTGVEWRDDDGHDSLWYQDGEKGDLKTVSLAGPDPWDEHPAMPSRELIELQHTVDTMFDVTGFYKDSLVTYILTDIPPEWPPLRSTSSVIFHEFTGISRTQVAIDLLTGDVPDTEIRQTIRQYRKRFSTTRKKRLSPKDHDFLALVKRYGPVPRGRGSGAMAFWEKIRLAWNEKNRREVWKEAGTARKHYTELEKRARKKGAAQ